MDTGEFIVNVVKSLLFLKNVHEAVTEVAQG